MNSTLPRLSLGALFFATLVSTAVAQGPERWTFTDSAPATRLGTDLASAGDINLDGILDVIVGAPRADVGGPATGGARVLSGVDGSELFAWTGVSASSWFGASVDGGYDVNRDGSPDVLVGAPLGTPDSGTVFLYSGADGTRLASYSGSNSGDQFGDAVCFLGDVNSDGIVDFAVGAPHADGGGWNAGEVSVHSGQDGTVLYNIQGASADFLGFDLARLEDVDEDCVPDLLIGAPFSDTAGFNAGSAYVHSGATGTRLLTLHGTAAGDWFGSRVADLGDLDGDDVSDCGIGAPGSDLGGLDSGAVLAHSGASGSPLLAIPGGRAGEYMQAVSGLGDVNGDGVREFLVGSASAAGGGVHSGRVQIVSGSDGSVIRSYDGRRLAWHGAAIVGLEGPNRRIDFAVGAPGHDDYPSLLGYVRLYRATRMPQAPGAGPAPTDCK